MLLRYLCKIFLWPQNALRNEPKLEIEELSNVIPKSRLFWDFCIFVKNLKMWKDLKSNLLVCQNILHLLRSPKGARSRVENHAWSLCMPGPAEAGAQGAIFLPLPHLVRIKKNCFIKNAYPTRILNLPLACGEPDRRKVWKYAGPSSNSWPFEGECFAFIAAKI